MPRMNWFRSWRQNSVQDKATRSTAKTPDTKQEPEPLQEPEPVMTQPSSRSHSQTFSRRISRDERPSVIVNKGVHNSSTCKPRRRFTIHGMSYHCACHENGGWNCNFASKDHSLFSVWQGQGRSRLFGSGRTRRAATYPLPSTTNPSIIFIDCPP